MTLAEKLLAGHHAGCPTWEAVAKKLGVDPRHLRVVRATLRGMGQGVELLPHSQFANSESTAVHKTKPTVQVYADLPKPAELHAGASQGDSASGPAWANVEKYDALVAPDVDVVPPGHAIKGVSSFVVDGEVRGQWIKTTAQNDERAAWLDAIRSLGEELPRYTPTAAPAYNDDDLLAVYPVGDPHCGLLAWHEDAGENFDLEIAERQLVNAFEHLVALAPAAAEALIVFIGDNTHADGQMNTTTKGTRVDVDGRMVKVARTLIQIIRRAVAIALTKHGRVTLIIERGNHDELIAAMVALALSIAYEDEPRVTVDVSPEMFHWFRWGSLLIGTHHGDKVKPMDLLGVMAVDRQEDWSTTKHRRFYLGHYHHQIVKEVPGLICEYLPTLASSDAWHRSMGYRSQRAMYMDVFHREDGHVLRHMVGVQKLRAA